MASLATMMNLGKEMERKLRSVGIDSAEALLAAGSREAFARLKAAYPNVCLVHLYCLEGAVTQTEYNALPDAVKRSLKAFSDGLKGENP